MTSRCMLGCRWDRYREKLARHLRRQSSNYQTRPTDRWYLTRYLVVRQRNVVFEIVVFYNFFVSQCLETTMMRLSAVVVEGIKREVSSSQPSGLVETVVARVKVWKKGLKAFLQNDICILCENTHCQPANHFF